MAEQRNKELMARRRLSLERQRLISWVLLIALAGGGVTALTFFFRLLLAPEDLGSLSLPVVAVMAVEGFERTYLIRALRQHGGNVSRTAEAIGMVRQSLQQKIRELGLRSQDWSEDA